MFKMKSLGTRALSIAAGLLSVCLPSGAQSSGGPEELLRQAVVALATSDQPALAKLSIDQAEFQKFVWPTMAAQMSKTTAEKYFPTYQRASQAGAEETKASLAGKKWELVKVDLGTARRKGKDFQLFGPPAVTLRDDSGQEKTFRLLGGLLESNGAYKITTYYVNPTQRGDK